MEKLINKLKANSIITAILLVISATWIVIDYMVLNDLKTKMDIDFGVNWLLFLISGVAFIAFHLSVFALLILNFRIVLKKRSDLKKEEKQQKAQLHKPEENE